MQQILNDVMSEELKQGHKVKEYNINIVSWGSQKYKYTNYECVLSVYCTYRLASHRTAITGDTRFIDLFSNCMGLSEYFVCAVLELLKLKADVQSVIHFLAIYRLKIHSGSVLF